MIRSGNNILKNGECLFKSQALESYLEHNYNTTTYLTLNYSDVTSDNPIIVYYKTSNGVDKKTLVGKSESGNNLNFTTPNNTLYKSFYFRGSLENVHKFSFNRTCRGNLIKLMNQFPNLSSFSINNGIFNQNISNSFFPSNLINFYINDNSLSGNINTIGNLNNIETIYLRYCNFNGNFTNIDFKNLIKLNYYIYHR